MGGWVTHLLRFSISPLKTPFLPLSLSLEIHHLCSLSCAFFVPMASSILFASGLSTAVRASALSTGKPDQNRMKTAPSNWWAPLFGWSSDPDYVGATGSVEISSQKQSLQAEPESSRSRSKFVLGCFTEEKARQLRKKTMENSSFHDIMYHSAIASRLASDVTGGSEE